LLIEANIVLSYFVVVSADELRHGRVIAEKAHSNRQLVQEWTHAVTEVVLSVKLKSLVRMVVFQDVVESSILRELQI